MKQIWFEKADWLYLLIHAIGILLTLGTIVFMIPVCTEVFRNGHSISNDLYEKFVFPTCTAFWWK